MTYNDPPSIEDATYTRALRSALEATPGTCGTAYIDAGGELKILGNTNGLELADLFDRAAAKLRESQP